MSQGKAPAGLKKLSDSYCAQQYAASLKCLEDADYDKSKCQHRFDDYKECKKRERAIRLEENKSKSMW